jgi:NAD(P)-dependent dehydrogenase (short-subunit alcohol dehydrogenase family)
MRRDTVSAIGKLNMPKIFERRTALVTGAASGIGMDAARIFAEEGAAVIVSTDLNIEGGKETVRMIRDGLFADHGRLRPSMRAGILPRSSWGPSEEQAKRNCFPIIIPP